MAVVVVAAAVAAAAAVVSRLSARASHLAHAKLEETSIVYILLVGGAACFA